MRATREAAAGHGEVTTRGRPVVGWAAHERAVRRLRASYDAIPPGQPIRLAKRTSNLFRPRAGTQVPGLDVSGLSGVIAIDPEARTADVQGMCTYEDLVDVTLRHRLIPLVVPQLRTITLGGAVTGLGIESTSFRNGLPHESVLEMDVLTGAGEVVTTRPGEELFEAFPNSYGSLGYTTRIRIELEPVEEYVALRHLRFEDLGALTRAVETVVADRAWEGERVDGIDGVVFEPGEAYLTLARWTGADEVAARGEEPEASDYTGSAVFYRSLQQRERDLLTTYDYLWRWDTDWFWCSRAFGVQHPLVRRVWPRRWRRSDVYHRLVGLENRFGVMARVDAARGKPARERVIQDVEVPVERLPDFLSWFDAQVGMRPVWLCPLRLREPEGPGSATTWPAYPLTPGTTYVNVGFWGTVPIAEGAADGDLNRAIEQRVTELGGHKSLYSDAYYDRATFDRLYNGAHHAAVKSRFDPDDRLTGLYEKAVNRR
ncbi:MAG TPA: FAD-binding oxidoreductase [Nocardioidaceae bacterium]|nr:FAD-binding oxidoreductase [Nocardioidaceae bacterium]